MPIDPLTGLEQEEEDQQYYPGALPTPNRAQLGALRDKYFDKNVALLREHPDFADLEFETGQPAGEWDEEVTVTAPPADEGGWDEPVTIGGGSIREEDPTWEDYGRMLMSGGASIGAGLGWALEKVGAEGIGGALKEASNSAVESWLSGLSPQAREALQTEFLKRDEGELWTPDKFNRVKLQTVQSILGTAAGLGVGAIFTKGLAAAGMTRAATGAAGAAVTVPSRTAGAIGYGLGEAAIAAPAAGAGAEEKITSASHEELMKMSIEYQALYDNADPDKSHEEKVEHAKKLLGAAVGGDASAITALTTFLMSAPAGAYFSKMFAGKPLVEGGGYAANVARGAGTEFAQEFGQSGAERLSENLAVRFAGGYGESQPVFEGVLEEATGGALSGGLLGGTMALPGGASATPPAPPEVTPEVPEQKTFEDTSEDNMSQAEKEALLGQLDELEQPEGAVGQGELDIPPPPAPTAPAPTAPPQEGQAPTPIEPLTPATPTPAEAAPTAVEPTPSPVGEEVVITEDLVTQPTPEVVTEPTPVEEPAPVETPMIERKSLEGKFRELNKKTKEGMPGLRKAVRELGTAIQAVFPDAKNLPLLGGTIGPKRMADFFATLDEEIVIDETLPNLKGYLEAVLESPDAANAIQNINTLKDYVANSGAGVVQGEATPVVEQASRGLTAFDAFEAQRQQKRTQQTKLAERAVAVDELATVVSALTEEATTLGINVPAEVTETIRRARSYRESSQVAKPRTLKGGAGATVTPQRFSGKNLTEVGGILREAAQTLAEQISAVDVTTSSTPVDKPKKAKAKVKVEERSAVTEAPAKPKKETKGQRVRKQAKKLKQKSEKPAKKVTVKELRAHAKRLNIPGRSKMTRAGLIDAIEKEEGVVIYAPAEKKAPKKPRKIADPEKVIEVLIDTSKPAMTGKQSGMFGAEMGVEEGKGVLDRALKEAGVPKSTAKLLRGIALKLDKTGRKKVVEAVSNFQGSTDRLEFVTAIYDAVGGKINDAQMQDLMNFAENKAAKVQTDPNNEILSAQEEAIKAEAEAQGYDPEDYKTLLEETGQYIEEQAEADPREVLQSDEYFGLKKDEIDNSSWITEIALPQGALEESRQLTRALVKAKTGLFSFMAKYTHIRGVANPGPTNVNELLQAIVKALPSNNRYVPLARKLLSLNLDVPVYIYEEAPTLEGGTLLGSYYPGSDYDPSDRRIRLYINNEAGSGRNPTHIFATALHEVVHAATVAAYRTDPVFRAELDALYDRAILEMDRQFPDWRTNGMAELREFYGLANQEEFIAEALTNPDFQTFLSDIDSINNRAVSPLAKVKGLMRDFLNAIKKQLGYSVRNSLLEDVILLAESNLQTEEEILIAQQKLQVEVRRDKEAQPEPLAVKETRNDIRDSVDVTKEGTKTIASAIGKGARDKGSRGLLAISGRDAIERDNRSLFNKAAKALGISNPLTAFDRAKNRAQTLVRGFEKKAFDIIKLFSDLSRAARSVSEVIMRDVTMANIDPTQPLNSKANAHIWTNPTQNPKPRKRKDGTWYTPKAKKPQIRKKFKVRAIKARDDWLAFSKQYPAAAKVVQKMAELTKQIHDTKVSYALTALGEAFEFDAATTKALGKAKTSADIDAIIAPDEVKKFEAQLEAKEDLVGLTKEEKKELKKKIAGAEARAQAAKSAKTILRESSIKGWYFPLRRYGEYVVATGPDVEGEDRYVSFHETAEEAELVRDRINDTASSENQVSVSKKLEANTTRGAMSDVISDLERRIRDGETKARLRGAMAEVLAGNAAYQSQLKRLNVEGVASQDMARAFEEYVHVSKYTLGDIRYAHQVSEALKSIRQIARNQDGALTDPEAYQAGNVQKEIAKRNKAEGGDRKRNTTQKTIGMLGFLNFLGAPSYWALNFTQTYVVTLPYLSAKYGEKKGPLALFRAQKQVFGAVFAAMRSGDKSYEGFKSNLPSAARRVVETLEADNVIQSTIAHEFGDILNPRGFKRMRKHALTRPVAKGAEHALMLMERIPEAIEHYNRISTALATYELSNGNYEATKDAVNETQMNYDTNNRARLLKSLPGDTAGVTTPFVTPIMMFKTFGVGMAKLFYGAAFQGAMKEGGRKEGMKLAGYLMATHTLFGGVAGGVMVAPIAAIIAAMNSALDPDDEWDLEETAYAMGEELGGDLVGTMFEKGLPAALAGIDMSRSINLGNLIWMGNDSLDYSKYGDIERGAFQVFGPVAQYGANTVREGFRLLTGDPRGGLMEFAQAAIPVKAVRGSLQAIEYETKGMETGSELQLLSPAEFSAFLRTAAGFQASQKTNVRDEYYRDQRLEQRRADRKSVLMVRANRAIEDGNWSRLAAIMEDMQAFNMSVPEARFRVTPGDMARLRSRRRTAQRDYDRRYRYSD